ncbi:hypothetical protein HZH66_014490 [Vespula vulgaris]|uniref:Uncharacterized protein n=1 Tax=Vespula vulgaris TaxID=7454 RepID=A0A834MPI8_VESVU|nr:hypothetical protein HZH66_014490 [Vespula vulgaris]
MRDGQIATGYGVRSRFHRDKDNKRDRGTRPYVLTHVFKRFFAGTESEKREEEGEVIVEVEVEVEEEGRGIARQGKARQDKARQDKTRHGMAWHGVAWHGKTRLD